jgi:hypothetical protein
LERSGQSGCAVAHDLPVRKQAQEAEHGEAAEPQRRGVYGPVSAGGRDVLWMPVPGQRQPHVDVNQIRRRKASPYWDIGVRAGPSP